MSESVGANVSAQGGARFSAEHPLTDEGSQEVVRGERVETHCVNDPSAGSLTESLLRLLLPLSDKVHAFRCDVQKLDTSAIRIIHRITQSVGATGGVYKGQGRNQHELVIRAY